MSSRGLEKSLQKAREQERMRQQGQSVPVKPRRTLSTDPDRELTPLMWEALALSDRPTGVDPWKFASGIIGALKAAGLVVRDDDSHAVRPYRATEAGKRRMGERNR